MLSNGLNSFVSMHGYDINKQLAKYGMDFQSIEVFGKDVLEDIGFERADLYYDRLDQSWSVNILEMSDPFGNEENDFFEIIPCSKFEGIKIIKKILDAVDDLVNVTIIY